MNSGGVGGIFLFLFVLAFLAFVGFVIYFVFKQVQFVIQAVNLYKDMVRRLDKIIELLSADSAPIRAVPGPGATIQPPAGQHASRQRAEDESKKIGTPLTESNGSNLSGHFSSGSLVLTSEEAAKINEKFRAGIPTDQRVVMHPDSRIIKSVHFSEIERLTQRQWQVIEGPVA
jgi:hypothetical protein